MDNAVETAYTAWPDRYYLIDKDGRIAAKGKPGPAGFKAPEIELAIVKLLELRMSATASPNAAIPRRDRQGAFFAGQALGR